MIRTEEIAAYLESRGVTAPVQGGGEIPTRPDRVVLVNQTGGAGETKERVFEKASMQIRCRGLQNDPGSAEDLADRVDRALMDATYPIQVGHRHVLKVEWLGGPPQLLSRDSALRSEFVTNYLFEIAR